MARGPHGPDSRWPPRSCVRGTSRRHIPPGLSPGGRPLLPLLRSGRLVHCSRPRCVRECQARVMLKRIAKMCQWKKPRAPAVRLIFDVRAAPAVLTFLRDTRVGRMVPLALQEDWRGEDTGREIDREGGEGGPGPAVECTFPLSCHLSGGSFSVRFFPLFSSSSFLTRCSGALL